MSCALGFVPVLKQVGIYLNVLCFRVNQVVNVRYLPFLWWRETYLRPTFSI